MYYTEGGDHQWLDKNGWLHRSAYVINRKNNAIYQITMDIGKASDGRTILYALNGNAKRIGNAEVSSMTIESKARKQNAYSNNSIYESSKKTIGFLSKP